MKSFTRFPCTNGSGTVTMGSNFSNAVYLCGTAVVTDSSSGSITVTVSVTGTCGGCNLLVEEWAGDASSSPLDGENSTYTFYGSSGTSLPSGSFSTSQTDTVEAVYFSNLGAVPTTNPSGFSQAANDLTGNGWLSTYKATVGSASQDPTYSSASSGSNAWVTAAGFKQTGGGGGGGAVYHSRLLRSLRTITESRRVVVRRNDSGVGDSGMWRRGVVRSHDRRGGDSAAMGDGRGAA